MVMCFSKNLALDYNMTIVFDVSRSGFMETFSMNQKPICNAKTHPPMSPSHPRIIFLLLKTQHQTNWERIDPQQGILGYRRKKKACWDTCQITEHTQKTNWAPFFAKRLKHSPTHSPFPERVDPWHTTPPKGGVLAPHSCIFS